ncbi:MAG: FG-GAP-like repeat-containing protein [Rhodothermales bacterium]
MPHFPSNRSGKMGSVLRIVSTVLFFVCACIGCNREPQADLSPEEEARLWRCRNIGRAHFYNGDNAEAINTLSECATLSPDSYADHLNVAIALVRGGDLDAARDHLAQLLTLRPKASAPHYLLGIIAARTGDFTTARDELKQVADAGEGDAPTWYHLGHAYRQVGDFEAAEAALREAIRLDPRHAGARYALSLVLRRLGRTEPANEQLQTVTELRRTIPEFLRTREALENSIHTELIVPDPPRSSATVGRPLRFADVSEQWLPAGLPTAVEAVVVDFDRDDDPDVLLWTEDGIITLRNEEPAGMVQIDMPALSTRTGTNVSDLPGPRFTKGDFSHDGIPDLVALTDNGPRFFLGTDNGSFVDETTGSGLTDITGEVATSASVDFDHDGDLDLVLWTAQSGGRLLLLANEGRPTEGDPIRFHEVAAPTPLDAGLKKPARILWTDLDANDAVDLLALGESEPGLLIQNLRQGRFARREQAWGWSDVRGRAAALGDVNGDLQEDLVRVGSDGWHLYLGDRFGPLTERRDLLPRFGLEDPLPDDVLLADLDNDGDLDGVVTGAARGGRALTILRNDGARLIREREDVLPDSIPHIHTVRAADFDRDGRLDLLLLRPDGPPTLLRNTGSHPGRGLEVRLEGLRNAGDGTGTVIEVRSGHETLRRIVREPTTFIGIGERDRVEAIRLIWPNGASQSSTDVDVVPGRPLIIEEKREVAGSCPILYVWDGSGYRMATDLLGTSPLGFPLGPGLFATPQGEEIVTIPDGVPVAPHDGRYLISIAEEMREIVYLDRLRLLVVDHPSDIGVYSNYVFREPPFDPPQVIALNNLRGPRRVVDQNGRDVTELLASMDRRYPQPFTMLNDPFQGFATLQTLTLDFGDLSAYESLWLIMSGWTDWTDGPSEAAASQHPEVELVLPTVEVPDGHGGWKAATDWFGFPSLKTKDIMLDLTGTLTPGDHRIRIRTNLRVYWDRIQVGERVPDNLDESPVMNIHTLEPEQADLAQKGMSAQSSPDGHFPLIYAYDEIRPDPVWRSHTGLATRYGDVTDLLRQADDRMAVFTFADEVRVSFDAANLPPLPPGWRRNFFLHSHGWTKEGDFYTAHPATIEPLPFRAMSTYPYDPGREAYPLTDSTLRYLFEYNTRPVGTHRIGQATGGKPHH